MQHVQFLGGSNFDPSFMASAPDLFGGASGDMMGLSAAGEPSRAWRIAWGVAGTVSMAASAFHGYRRNESVGWALWWGLMGGLFPIITPVVAVAQGYAKPKRRW